MKVKVGITIGDINSIGLEVILKVLREEAILKQFTPIIYGSSKAVAYHRNVIKADEMSFQTVHDGSRIASHKIGVVNCWDETVQITLGKITEEGGQYAYLALDKAVKDLKEGKIDVLVTAPIHKEAMQKAKFPYKGHTDFLEDMFATKGMMMMVNDDLRLGLVTTHIPISEVAENMTTNRLNNSIHIFNESLKNDFGIGKPVIGVLGLNPHAGDGQLMGAEEEEVITPAIMESKENGILAMGPYSSDAYFGSMAFRKMDGTLAMYHDQGLIPFKTLAFSEGVNYTAGLPYVRTSPDHGTAMDIAGKNCADPTSMRNAIFLAVDIYKNRNFGNSESDLD